MIMGKRNIFNQNLILIAGIVFLLFAFGLNLQFPREPLKITKQESATNVNQTALRIGSLGNKRLISSILWITTLLESDTTHYKRRDLSSWMYLRFMSIATLDPKFYENYLWGGMYLSIVKDDLEGAAEIFERGLEYYPEDFKLIYQAGFHYYSEMGNFERGLELLKKVENSPQAPGPLKFIIKKLNYETTGDYETTLQFLLYSLETAKDDKVLTKKLSEDIYALKAKHDLDCLNSENNSMCDRIDAHGNPYELRGKIWETIKPFLPYKIHRK
jgi:tetratricopeptide (TPR) repeat protein